MSDFGFEVCGSRPPSVAALRPGSSTSSYASPRRPPSRQKHNYMDDVVERRSSSSSVKSAASQYGVTPQRAAFTHSGKPKNRHNPSYVDETLFGNRQADPDFAAPWEDSNEKREKPHMFDMYNHRPKTGETRGSRSMTSSNGIGHNRPSSSKMYHKSSYVEENRIGSQSGEVKSKPFLFDVKDYKIGAKKKQPQTSVKGFYSDQYGYFFHTDTRSNVNCDSSRTSANTFTNGYHSNSNRKCKNRHNPTYIEEGLFDNRQPEPDFPAPWGESDEGRPPILSGLFEATDYKVKVFGGRVPTLVEKPRWKPQRPTARASASAKPKWR